MYYIEHSFKVDKKEAIINYLQKNKPVFSKKIIKTGNLDGFKYIFEDNSWVLLRFSGTENLIRVVVEQPTKEEMDSILEQSINIIKSI